MRMRIPTLALAAVLAVAPLAACGDRSDCDADAAQVMAKPGGGGKGSSGSRGKAGTAGKKPKPAKKPASNHGTTVHHDDDCDND